MLIRAVLPNLKAAKSPKVIVMGSGMGSIANNKGGAYAYGASKAGLNYVVKSFVGDVPEVTFGIIHPGRVESRMTHVREDGAIDADEAIAMMLPIIEGIQPEQSGMFVTRENKPIPW
jgi:NAD(P)-dependent dehydrogenase (short-subunit alcohol dehydrogenase family)